MGKMTVQQKREMSVIMKEYDRARSHEFEVNSIQRLTFRNLESILLADYLTDKPPAILMKTSINGLRRR